jgi:selenocysteine lyase/cysteine desulfurase
MIDPSARLRDFPHLEDISHLSTCAEGISPIHVGAAINEYWQHRCQGLVGRGIMQQRMAEAREVAGAFLGLQAEEVTFAGSCAEAYNLLATCLDLKPSDEVIVTDLDFASGVTPWHLAKLKPSVRVWHQRGGSLELMDLLQLITSRTRLVQLSLISPVNGFHIPWRSIADKVRKMAPQAVIALDVTQALGRVPVAHCADADLIVSAGHTWALGIHGAAIVGVPRASAEKLTTRAGGWRHLQTRFNAQRQELPILVQHGAQGFGVGTPSYPAIYALHASLQYIQQVGLDAIVAETDVLMEYLYESLCTLGLQPMATIDQGLRPTGLIAVNHPNARDLQLQLLERGVEIAREGTVMRFSVHGYTTDNDINRLLTLLDKVLP